MATYRQHVGEVDLAALTLLDAQIDEKVLGPAVYTFAELADASGWQAGALADLFLWSGTPAAEPDQRVYTEIDRQGLTQLKGLSTREGLTVEDVAAFARSLSYAMERLALTEVEAIVRHLGRDGRSDTAARAAAAEFAPTQGEVLLEQIATLWRRHYAAAIHRLTTGAILHRGVSDDDQEFPLVCSVGYAKIANFAESTADFGVAKFAKLVQSFHDLSSDTIVAAGGRIIRHMGDFVVWVTHNTAASAEIALQLTRLPENRFGGQLQVAFSWCRVMSINGDIFGPGVNLVIKLAEQAPVGGVLIDDAAATQLANNSQYVITPQPELNFKGMGTVRPFRLEAADPAE